MKTRIFYTIKILCYLGLYALLFVLFLNFFNSFYKGKCVSIDVSGGNMGTIPVEVFYTNSATEGFSAEKSQHITQPQPKDSFSFKGNILLNTADISALRIDLGEQNGGEITVKSLKYKQESGFFTATAKSFENALLNDLALTGVFENGAVFRVIGPDPYFVIDNVEITPYKEYGCIFGAIMALVCCFVLNRFVRIKSIYSNIMDFYSNRRLIMNLALNDFKTKYAGSYFGIVWAFVQPVCTILVFWFVFQVGFRNADIGDVPFILWFASGIIPWFFFSDAWNMATNAFVEYSYLVKKVVFKINILPVVKIISALFVHLFFVLFLMFLFLCYRYTPTLCCVQLLYYMLCMIMLILGLSLITAPLIIFFRDLGQLMNIVLQFGMWLTPIMWNINNIPQQYQWLFKLNPMYYIVQGYRDSMFTQLWFFDNIKQTLYFWAVVLMLILIGSNVYKRLKPHFADVL